MQINKIKMKIVSVFNNKGGVGKTTLCFHLAHALGTLGKKVLLIDTDPQCNLSLYGLSPEELDALWTKESDYIDDLGFEAAKKKDLNYYTLIKEPRTIHFLLKPTEDGTGDVESMPPLIELGAAVYLLPGRLSLHTYEEAAASRWSEAFIGNPLALKTITKIRDIAKLYSDIYNFDYVIMDTSPSIGILNKIILSNSDALIVPCNADMFSLYGIRNIGSALKMWKQQFEILKSVLSEEKKKMLSESFIQFIGYTLYNCKKVTKDPPYNEYDIAKSHYHYASKIPATILDYIPIRGSLSSVAGNLLGNKSIIHTHNTLPGMSQKYKKPMWELPSLDLDQEDLTIKGNRSVYEATLGSYQYFANDFISRLNMLDDER